MRDPCECEDLERGGIPCGAFLSLKGGIVYCTRKRRHEGDHSACAFNDGKIHHKVVSWKDLDWISR